MNKCLVPGCNRTGDHKYGLCRACCQTSTIITRGDKIKKLITVDGTEYVNKNGRLIKEDPLFED